MDGAPVDDGSRAVFWYSPEVFNTPIIIEVEGERKGWSGIMLAALSMT